MTMLDALKAYTADKTTRGFDGVKKIFFEQVIDLIENKRLTITALTKLLTSISTEDRQQLFLRQRNFNQPSTNSGAAQWILTLYRSLGLPFDEQDLSTIVHQGVDETYANQLKNRLYQQWQQDRFSAKKAGSLEKEIKGLLGFYTDNSLASDVLLQARTIPGSLASILNTVEQYYPDYLLEVVYKLSLLVSEADIKLEKSEGSIDKLWFEDGKGFRPTAYYILSDSFIGQLSEVDNAMLERILPVSDKITARLVMIKPNLFLTLSSSMQAAVLKRLNKIENSKLFADLAVLAVSSEKMDYFKETIFDKKHPGFQQAFNQICIDLNNADKLIETDQQSAALKIIDDYLQKAPNAFKTAFFTQLRDNISEHGLSIAALEQAIRTVDRPALFAKWSGLEKSRAAHVMAELYHCVNINPLDEEQINAMLTEGKLPETITQEEQIAQAIEAAMLHPQHAKHSSLGHAVKRQLNYYRSLNQVARQSLSLRQDRAEAIYQAHLINKGLKIAKQQTPAIFDLQGHVLVGVHLDTADLNEILSEITGEIVENGTLELLAESLGVDRIADTTLCNLDIVGQPELEQAFKKAILGHLPSARAAIVSDFLKTGECSSVIGLQEELSMHTLLSLRVLENAMKKNGLDIVLTAEERQALLAKINQKVFFGLSDLLYASQIVASDLSFFKFDFIYLNQQLDAARARLAPECRELLVDALLEKMSEEDKGTLCNDVLATLEDHDFSATTATGMDYLRTDVSNQTVVRISGTDHTAHNKEIGAEKQALRLLARNRYTPKNGVEPYLNRTQEARVPSTAVTNGIHAKIVADVKAKFNHSVKQLRDKNPSYNGPMIYNLLTSLHSDAYDRLVERKNRPRKNVDRILSGAHAFNRSQLEQGRHNQLVYVQNIPVNQHTNRLDNKAFDNATAEATLMADMALMSTFKQYSPVFSPALACSIEASYDAMHNEYLHFLATATSESRFKDSSSGKRVIEQVTQMKKIWSEAINDFPKSNDLNVLAVQALFKMMVTNEYHNKQFGMLVQSLSVFIEPLSQAGCKSANERYQAVAGRVELLKSLSTHDKLTDDKKAVIGALRDFVKGKAKVSDIQEKLDSAYNQYNLQGSAAVFSEEDQGASSKVRATANRTEPGKVSEINTNYAETGFLTRLYQRFSAAMQSHKAKLADVFRALFVNKIKLTNENVSSQKNTV